MAYEATVLEVMIASPSDVANERKVVRETVTEWNVLHSRKEGVVLMPIGWETHSSPELSGRPQQMINDRVLQHADVLVGIFWTRLGSPTGKSASGTVEEIEEHQSRGRPVMLYFSRAPVVPDSLDHEQYAKLREFKAWASKRGLVEYFDDINQFRELFRRQLPITMRDNDYIKDVFKDSIGEDQQSSSFGLKNQERVLSNEGMLLLRAAVSDTKGRILYVRSLNSSQIIAGRERFNGSDHRSIALWAGAIDELLTANMIQSLGSKSEVFEVTDRGYRHVELINDLIKARDEAQSEAALPTST